MDSANPSHTYDLEADAAARQVRLMDREEPVSRPTSIAHAYVVPVSNKPRSNIPSGFWWRTTIPVCPTCGGEHYHGGGAGEEVGIPFDIATRSALSRVPHCNPETFVNRRWWEERARKARAAASELIAATPPYELIIDLFPPEKTLKKVPDHLRYESWIALPSNAENLALDSEVY